MSHLAAMSASVKDVSSVEYPVCTIVADADWTLYNARSEEDTFGNSPAQEAVLTWIRSGIRTNTLAQKIFTHRLIVSTGGDYNTVQHRFLQHLPSDVQPAITLVTNSGARLFYYDMQKGLQEDSSYILNGIPGGVCIDKAAENQFLEDAITLLNLFFSALKKDPKLQEEVKADPYGHLIEEFAQRYSEPGFTMEDFKKEGRILYGIHKSASNFPRIEIRQIQEGQTVQISIVGMFSTLPSLRNYPEFQACLKAMSQTPDILLSQNLCVLEVSKATKGTALHYLQLDPRLSCGIGDSPDGNDKPLTEYRVHDQLMPFISVAKTTPKNDQLNHVGNTVLGTKRFFEALTAEGTHPDQPFSERVRSAYITARQ